MWLRRWLNREPDADVAPDAEADEAALELRRQALTMTAADAGMAPNAVHTDVWGMVMETGYPEAVATLVALGDGTTSLYLSTGGGVIGAGAYPAVRAAAETFLAVAARHLDAFEPAASAPLPAVGRVRFYARTFGGTLTAEDEPAALADEAHPLAPVFQAGQAVLTVVREVSTRRPA
jgi:hypothetical protein